MTSDEALAASQIPALQERGLDPAPVAVSSTKPAFARTGRAGSLLRKRREISLPLTALAYTYLRVTRG